MARLTGFNILIVDDEKANLDVLNHILRPNYKIYMAKSGATALKRAKELKPDLILLDIIMPDMNGFEVLEQLKECEETAAIPVIFITGLASVEDQEKGFRLGAMDYITKPFHNSIVMARVKTQLRLLKQMRTIERLGMIDALTDIANRRNFDHQLSMEWSRAIRDSLDISLLMIDVDNFKIYNDTYGHPQGDVLLQTLAQVFLKSLFRNTDIVARYGGEEFAVILPHTDLGGALVIAERLRANVEATEIDNISDDGTNAGSSSATISVGVASIMPSADDEISEFIQRADKELYRAKKTGKNKVCY